MLKPFYLALKDRGNGEVPSSVSGHEETQKGPDSGVVEGRDKDSGSTTCSKDVSPGPLVQIITRAGPGRPILKSYKSSIPD